MIRGELLVGGRYAHLVGKVRGGASRAAVDLGGLGGAEDDSVLGKGGAGVGGVLPAAVRHGRILVATVRRRGT